MMISGCPRHSCGYDNKFSIPSTHKHVLDQPRFSIDHATTECPSTSIKTWIRPILVKLKAIHDNKDDNQDDNQDDNKGDDDNTYKVLSQFIPLIRDTDIFSYSSIPHDVIVNTFTSPSIQTDYITPNTEFLYQSTSIVQPQLLPATFTTSTSILLMKLKQQRLLEQFSFCEPISDRFYLNCCLSPNEVILSSPDSFSSQFFALNPLSHNLSLLARTPHAHNDFLPVLIRSIRQEFKLLCKMASPMFQSIGIDTLTDPSTPLVTSAIISVSDMNLFAQQVLKTMSLYLLAQIQHQPDVFPVLPQDTLEPLV